MPKPGQTNDDDDNKSAIIKGFFNVHFISLLCVCVCFDDWIITKN